MMSSAKVTQPAERPGFQFANSRIAIYLSSQIDALKGEKSQREIAADLGYASSNIISMFKSGQTRVPLDKIPDFARVLHVDPAHLFRLAMEQYWPDRHDSLNSILGNTVTKNEAQGIVAAQRAVFDDDPAWDGEEREKISNFLQGLRSKRRPAARRSSQT